MNLSIIRFINILGTVLILLPISVSADSQICTSLSDCRLLKQKVEEQIKFFLETDVPVFLPVAVDEQGLPLKLTHQLAVKYCSDMNAHLPTVREFAQWAKSLGAAGILELDYVINNLDNELPENYTLIRAIDPGNISDKFYFNFTGYTAPTQTVEQEWFWSSSTNKNYTDGFYLFLGSQGRLFYGSNMPNATLAVRCVEN